MVFALFQTLTADVEMQVKSNLHKTEQHSKEITEAISKEEGSSKVNAQLLTRWSDRMSLDFKARHDDVNKFIC